MKKRLMLVQKNLSHKELEKVAANIPNLGLGGKCIRDDLMAWAAQVRPGQVIVELGSFLGSATAYLCLGILRFGNKIPIYCYDLWDVDASYQRKSKSHL